MKKILTLAVFLVIPFLIYDLAFAETKEYSTNTPGRVIPKLPQTAYDPELVNGQVYPMWGPVCQRYTYSVVYADKEGRAPEYMQIYFNGKMIDMTPADKTKTAKEDYQQGVRYEFKYVPNKIGSNFYYYEASNGVGKDRASIIDSPDNGPVLFESALDKNEIGLIDTQKNERIFTYPTNEEWVDKVAFSRDGKYFAAKTTKSVLLFKTEAPQKPLWKYDLEGGATGDMVGGVALSGDGSTIVVSSGNGVVVFGRDSNKPRWEFKGSQATGVAISDNGKYLAAAVSTPDPNLTNAMTLMFWDTNKKEPLWRYLVGANFHDVDFSADGSLLVTSTGCPDRRAYVFSKDSKEPIFRSEMLTYDSPVQKARISRDGSLASFTTDGGPDSSLILLLDVEAKKFLWKYDDGIRRAGRSLGMTGDGSLSVVGNTGGNLYLFTKETNKPVDKWSYQSTFGALDISDDGNIIAAGGTDKNVHLINRNSRQKKDFVFAEFVDTLDVSSDGRYVVVGTGASPYFFESLLGVNQNKIYPCDKVIEPKPQDLNKGLVNNADGNNGIINTEPMGNRETPPNSPINFLLVIIPGVAFVITLLALGLYWVFVKFNLLRRKEDLLVLNRKIMIALTCISVVFFVATLVLGGLLFSGKLDTAKDQNPSSTKQSDPKMTGSNGKEIKDQGVCGNTICEPGIGESKQSCPKDCSASPE